MQFSGKVMVIVCSTEAAACSTYMDVTSRCNLVWLHVVLDVAKVRQQTHCCADWLELYELLPCQSRWVQRSSD